ncbi:hypothetical protein CLU92_0948 [Janthinobacterium sp. 61]|uniref:hypothetical protein n=1 Tax=Janthinobacterium sp. 61 TaxID=2035209 RepID=UPI000CC33CC7|nr:hypothetical protein [Janthinobacterium sp. 61]PKV43633.1 hypothetical protein CLU92_0948 [Janthinobacterium sp. 61]
MWLLFIKSTIGIQVRKTFSALALASVIIGCASPNIEPGGPIAVQRTTLEQHTINLKPGVFSVENSPSLDQVITTELGNTLISRRYSLSTQAIKLPNDLTHETRNNGVLVRLDIPSGTLRKIGEDLNGSFFASENAYRTLPTVNSREKSRAGIFVPKNASEAVLVFWSPRTQTHAFVDKPTMPIIFEKVSDMVEISPDNQKKELIYTGVSKNVISLVYREYQNDLARPAFSQDLKYDLGEGRVIGFKGARFEVLKATNLGLTFKTLKHLD